MSGQASAVGGCVLVEDVSDLLGAVVGDFDTDMRLICREGLTESFLLTLREPITRGAQEKPDLVEGITLAPAVTGPAWHVAISSGKDHPCARGDRLCLAGRDDVPHLERHRRA